VGEKASTGSISLTHSPQSASARDTKRVEIWGANDRSWSEEDKEIVAVLAPCRVWKPAVVGAWQSRGSRHNTLQYHQ
jgi:hypothetical protein